MIETYEVTQDILLAITGLGFLCGVLAAVFATRFFEVVHLHRMVDQTVYRLLLMCSKLDEDINFISALKETELQNQNFDENSRRKFRKLDEEVVKKWKNGVILNLVNYSPEKFRYITQFTNWDEAMRFLNKMHGDKNGR
jgi:hypothetical protein